MNVDRTMMTRAIQSGQIAHLISRGVCPQQFTKTPDGEELADVFEWLSDHARRYNVAPSIALFRERYPSFEMHPSSDPLDALIDSFFAGVKRRHFAAKIKDLAHAEYDSSKWGKLDELMLDAAKDLAAIVPSGRVSRFSDMHKRIDRYEAEAADPSLRPGYNMGIPPFDELLSGMRPGNLVTIAGYSGLGKSLASSWILMNCYEQGAMGLLMSLEMTAEECFERLDTMVTHFSHRLLSSRSLGDHDIALWQRIANQFSGVRNDIVVLDRALGTTTDRVFAEINRYHPDVAVIDYVQLMRSRQSYASQWQSLCDVTNELKEIALSTDTVIIMVSQDGRDAAKNGSTEENMGGSISVLQAADIYIGMHQTEEMYFDEEMEMRLLKGRRGARIRSRNRSVRLRWAPATMTFEYREPAEEKTAESFLRVVA